MSVPLKRLAMVIAGQSPASDDVSELGKGLPFIQGNAEFGVRTPTPKWQCDVAPKVALPGDVLVSVRAPVGATNMATMPLGIGRGVAAIRAWRADPDYLYWFVSSSSDLLNAEATGSTFTAVTAADLASLDVPVTDPEEQRRIADYLDRETATIDALIEKQRQLLRVLQVRRQGVVEFSLAHSGVPSVPLRRLMDGTVGIVVTPAQWYGDDGPVAIRGLNIRHGVLDMSNAVRLSAEGDALHPKSRLSSGDVVIVRTGDAGRAAVIPSELDGAQAVDVLIVRCHPNLDPHYLVDLLTSRILDDEVKNSTNGTIQGHLNVSSLKTLLIPLPSLEQQRALVGQWSAETAKIDALIAKAERFIELAQERRAALITAAVTGQVEIPAEESAA